MSDDAVKPTRHPKAKRAARPETDLSVLTPPVGLPAAQADPGPPPPAPAEARAEGPAEALAEPPGAARAPGRCVCGHPRAAHEHYRRGSDCGVCGAAQCACFRRRGGPLRRLLRRVRLVR